MQLSSPNVAVSFITEIWTFDLNLTFMSGLTDQFLLSHGSNYTPLPAFQRKNLCMQVVILLVTITKDIMLSCSYLKLPFIAFQLEGFPDLNALM